MLIDPFMIEARTLKDQALVNTLFTQGCKNELDDHDDSNKTDLNYLRYHVGFPIWDREFILVEKRFVSVKKPPIMSL